jgi:3-hydroxyacyl-[acyl-carrier-protein] dehydratase
MLDIEKIQKILPQRFPFLMIDRILELEPGKKVVAVKNASINEAFFGGHFPGNPVMPGVLIIESMAQAAIMLFFSEEQAASAKKISYYLGSVKVRFLNPVFPGDQLKITVEPVKVVSNAGIVNAVAEVAAKEVARGELSFSIKEE